MQFQRPEDPQRYQPADDDEARALRRRERIAALTWQLGSWQVIAGLDDDDLLLTFATRADAERWLALVNYPEFANAEDWDLVGPPYSGRDTDYDVWIPRPDHCTVLERLERVVGGSKP